MTFRDGPFTLMEELSLFMVKRLLDGVLLHDYTMEG